MTISKIVYQYNWQYLRSSDNYRKTERLRIRAKLQLWRTCAIWNAIGSKYVKSLSQRMILNFWVHTGILNKNHIKNMFIVLYYGFPIKIRETLGFVSEERFCLNSFRVSLRGLRA